MFQSRETNHIETEELNEIRFQLRFISEPEPQSNYIHLIVIGVALIIFLLYF